MGEGHPHSLLPCPFGSLLWAYLAPSLVPWTPPHVFRVSREASAGAHRQDPSFHAPSLLPRCDSPPPGVCPQSSQSEPPPFAPTPGHPSMGPMQRVTPPRGMASVGPQVRG